MVISWKKNKDNTKKDAHSAAFFNEIEDKNTNGGVLFNICMYRDNIMLKKLKYPKSNERKCRLVSALVTLVPFSLVFKVIGMPSNGASSILPWKVDTAARDAM